MKNLFSFLTVLSVTILHAQHVERNDILISAAPGYTSYAIELKDSNFVTHFGYSHKGIRTPLSVEYALASWIGISADFTYTQLMAYEWSSQTSVLDCGASLRFHSPSEDHRVDWFGAIGYHYSKYYGFDAGFTDDMSTVPFPDETTTASGRAIYFAVGGSMYFSEKEKFGMGLSLNGSSYKYPKAEWHRTNGASGDFKMGALALSAGISFFYKI